MKLFSKTQFAVAAVTHGLLAVWCLVGGGSHWSYFLGGMNIAMIAMWYLLYHATHYMRYLEDRYNKAMRRHSGGA